LVLNELTRITSELYLRWVWDLRFGQLRELIKRNLPVVQEGHLIQSELPLLVVVKCLKEQPCISYEAVASTRTTKFLECDLVGAIRIKHLECRSDATKLLICPSFE